MYYKPMGDLPYISSEQGGGLTMYHGRIMFFGFFLFFYPDVMHVRKGTRLSTAKRVKAWGLG